MNLMLQYLKQEPTTRKVLMKLIMKFSQHSAFIVASRWGSSSERFSLICSTLGKNVYSSVGKKRNILECSLIKINNKVTVGVHGIRCGEGYRKIIRVDKLDINECRLLLFELHYECWNISSKNDSTKLQVAIVYLFL